MKERNDKVVEGAERQHLNLVASCSNLSRHRCLGSSCVCLAAMSYSLVRLKSNDNETEAQSH